MTKSEELNHALKELEIVKNHFNHCDHDHIDFCIYRYNVAREKIRIILEREKKKKLHKLNNYRGGKYYEYLYHHDNGTEV